MKRFFDRTNTLPPKEIYDVLHEAEANGIELPKSVLTWWERETVLNEERNEFTIRHKR